MELNKKLNVKPFIDVLHDQTPEPTHIIGGGILPHKALLLITGQPKAKKSFLAQNLAIALSAGFPCACFSIEIPQKVLLLSAEGGYFSNKGRFQKMVNNKNAMRPENMHICFDARIKLENVSDVELLREKIKDLKPDVVIIDPLVKFHGEDENSSNEMANILNKLRDIIEDYDVSIILVHHQGKDGSRGARGSSAIMGEYDSCITISNKGKNIHELSFELRHAESPDNITLSFNPEAYWFEEYCVHPLVALVRNAGTISRKDLAESAVKNKLYKNNTGAYKKIKTLIERKVLNVDEDDKISIGSPLSNSPG